MRDKWYADNRDLVKWGVLLTLAKRHGVTHILQVLYYRPTEWAPLDVDGQQVPLPQEVIRHFRNAASVTAIDPTVNVEVMAEGFEDRVAYHAAALKRISSRPSLPGIVFLDPDTGLEPRTPTLDHVLEAELATLWRALGKDDILVFYQHQTNRNGQPWLPAKKEQFEQALGLSKNAAGVAQAVEIARDVAFFFARKAG